MTQNPLYEGLKINYLNIVCTTEEGAGIIRFSTLLTWASLIKKTNMRAADVGIVYYLVKTLGLWESSLTHMSSSTHCLLAKLKKMSSNQADGLIIYVY